MVWLWFLVPLAVLFIVAFIVDRRAKRTGRQMDMEEGAKNASDSERIYVETTLHNITNDPTDPM